MQQIIFLKGLPGSGKTTWATSFCLQHINFKRLNKDDIRIELGNEPFSRQFEKRVLNLQHSRGIEYLDAGLSLIIDDTNFSKRHWEFWKKEAEKRDIAIEEKFFDVPVRECIERDKKRDKSVGEKVIFTMYNQYLKGF
jgi:predicted kinase